MFLSCFSVMCNQRVALLSETCSNSECAASRNPQTGSSTSQQRIKTQYELAVSVSDHTGTIENCRLTEKCAEDMFGCKVSLNFKPVELTLSVYLYLFCLFRAIWNYWHCGKGQKFSVVFSKHGEKALPGLDTNWFQRLTETSSWNQTSSHRNNYHSYLKSMMCLEILSGGGYIWKRFISEGCYMPKKQGLDIYSFFFFLPYKAMDLASWTMSQLTELKVQFLLERCKVFFKVLVMNSHQITFLPTEK